MVGLAQLVSASGCGPEGRGFESHISPQKEYPYAKRRDILFGVRNGSRFEPRKFVEFANRAQKSAGMPLHIRARMGSESHISPAKTNTRAWRRDILFGVRNGSRFEPRKFVEFANRAQKSAGMPLHIRARMGSESHISPAKTNTRAWRRDILFGVRNGSRFEPRK